MFEADNAAEEIFGTDPSNLYEVLDIRPDATASEIRQAYLRIKSTYSKDSVALYTLVEPGEREDILKKVEEAYAVLSNPERRRAYDQGFSSYMNSLNGVSGGGVAVAPSDPAKGERLQSSNVVSIDRVPPMEPVENAENALVSPVTDFSFQSPVSSIGKGSSLFESAPFARSGGSESVPNAASVAKLPVPPSKPQGMPVAPEGEEAEGLMPPLPEAAQDIEFEIQAETEWSGAFLRRVRDSRGISIEDIVQATRVSRVYIIAIEEENLSKLPAPVYVRGFVNQIARVLRLASQDVAAAYMRRCQRIHPQKFR